MQYKTFISCRLPRYTNEEGKIKTIITLRTSKHERHTYLFERAVIDLLKATKNQTKASEIMRYGFNIINRIMHLSTERGLSRRDISKEDFEHLSIYEKSFKKGNNYITVLSQPKKGNILDVVENRTKEATKKLIT